MKQTNSMIIVLAIICGKCDERLHEKLKQKPRQEFACRGMYYLQTSGLVTALNLNPNVIEERSGLTHIFYPVAVGNCISRWIGDR